ncbi:MAG: SIS domain-containing protein [Gallionellaceae bacterium]|nr:SIS domain-containing protein [Gallionellaceae bacterium]
MPLQTHIHSRFLNSLEAQRDAIEQLAEPLARAAELMVESLMREGKILVCGQAGSHASARLFASLLTHQYQQARPGLTAIALDEGAHALADDGDSSAVFARQIENLGQAGDVLLAISGSGNAPGVLAALRGAHDKDLRVIVLAGGDGGLLAESLNEQDVVICTYAESAAITRELHLRAIHSLCDGIDYLLLGA